MAKQPFSNPVPDLAYFEEGGVLQAFESTQTFEIDTTNKNLVEIFAEINGSLSGVPVDSPGSNFSGTSNLGPGVDVEDFVVVRRTIQRPIQTESNRMFLPVRLRWERWPATGHSARLYFSELDTSVQAVQKDRDETNPQEVKLFKATYQGQDQPVAFTTFEPQFVMVARFRYEASNPDDFGNAWINKTNSDIWRGAEKWHWLTTRIAMKHNAQPGGVTQTTQWLVTMELVRFEQSLEQLAFFTKTEDGLPPEDANITNEVGVTKKLFQGVVDFSTLFPNQS